MSFNLNKSNKFFRHFVVLRYAVTKLAKATINKNKLKGCG
jgi:hypothetical protein